MKNNIFYSVFKIIGALLLSLVIFIGFLPTILSTQTAQKFILDYINKENTEKIYLEEAKFSWTKGAEFKNLAIYVPEKNLSLFLPYVTADYSLFSYLKNGSFLVELNSENGRFDLETKENKPIQVNQISFHISTKNVNEIKYEVKGVIEKDKQKGNLLLYGTAKDYEDLAAQYRSYLDGKSCDAKIAFDCSITQLPAQMLDLLLTLNYPKLTGLIQQSLGDTINLDLSHRVNVEGDFLKLAINSANLNSKFNIERKDGKLSLSESNFTNWIVTPEFFDIINTSYLQKNLKLSKSAHFLIKLNSTAQNHSDFPYKLKLETNDPISLTNKNNSIKTNLSCEVDILSKELVKGVCNLQRTDEKNPSFVKTSIEIKNPLSKEEAKLEINSQGNLTYLFSDYKEQIEKIVGKDLTYSISGEGKNLFSSEPIFSGKATLNSEKLNIENFEINVAEKKSTSPNISINWKGFFKEPHPEISLLCDKEFSGAIRASSMSSLKELSIAATVQSEILSLNIPQLNLNLDKESYISSDAPIECVFILQDKHYKFLENHKKETLVPKDSKIHFQLFPFKKMSLKNLKENANFNGKASIEEIKIAQHNEHFHVDIPFNIDIKNETISLDLNLASINANRKFLNGKLLYNFGLPKEKTKLITDGECKNLPVLPFLTIANKEKYLPFFGNDLSGSWNCELTDKEKRINVAVNTKDLTLNISLLIGEKIQSLSSKPPALLKINLTKDKMLLLLENFSKTGKDVDLHLKENTPVEIRVNKIDIHRDPKNIGCFLNSLEVDGEFFCDKITFLHPKKTTEYSLPSFQGKVQLKGSNKNCLFEMSTPASGKSKFYINGKASNLWDDTEIKLNQGDIEFDAHIEKWPMKILQKLPSFELGHKISYLIGDTLDAHISMKVEKMKEGDLLVDVTGKDFLGKAEAHIKDHKLYLKKDAVLKFLLTPKSRKAIFKDSNSFLSSGILRDLPVSVKINHNGFFMPLSPFLPKDSMINDMKVDLGKIYLEKKGFVEALTKILKPLASQKEIELESTPIHMTLQNGILHIKRVDALVGGNFHLIIWGTIDFKRNELKMVVGIHRDALEHAMGVKNLPPDYFLQLPLTGTLQKPEISTKLIALKLAALSHKPGGHSKKNKGNISGIIRGLYDITVEQVLQDPPPPPSTTYPLPWEERY